MNHHWTRHVPTALLASVALLSISGPAAHAAWQAPGTADSRYHCGGYNQELASISFQDCVVVTQSTGGVYVQSVMAVSNQRSTSAGLYGATTTFLDGGVLTDTDCGYTVIAPHARKWCWGATSPKIAHGRYVQGLGWLSSGAGWHTVWSPTRPT